MSVLVILQRGRALPRPWPCSSDSAPRRPRRCRSRSPAGPSRSTSRRRRRTSPPRSTAPTAASPNPVAGYISRRTRASTARAHRDVPGARRLARDPCDRGSGRRVPIRPGAEVAPVIDALGAPQSVLVLGATSDIASGHARALCRGRASRACSAGRPRSATAARAGRSTARSRGGRGADRDGRRDRRGAGRATSRPWRSRSRRPRRRSGGVRRVAGSGGRSRRPGSRAAGRQVNYVGAAAGCVAAATAAARTGPRGPGRALQHRQRTTAGRQLRVRIDQGRARRARPPASATICTAAAREYSSCDPGSCARR